jgi:hypothetical protein
MTGRFTAGVVDIDTLAKLPPVSTTIVESLPPVSTTPAINLPPVSAFPRCQLLYTGLFCSKAACAAPRYLFYKQNVLTDGVLPRDIYRTKRQATQHGCLPILIKIEIVYGVEYSIFLELSMFFE